MATIEFFWDVGSPYTYLASTQIDWLRSETGAEVVFKPFLLGGVFRATGNEMPARIPQKAAFMMKDVARWARLYDIPVKLPGETPFPINGLLPMRVAILLEQQGQGETYCHAAFKAYWAEGRDVSQPEILAEVIAGLGLDSETILAQAVTPENKKALIDATEGAVARGAFGAPAFFVGDEMFWGNDRLVQLVHHLKSA